MLLKTLKSLTPPLRRAEPGVLMLAALKGRRKRPLWLPDGWLIVTHAHKGTVSAGWTIGPANELAFAAFPYAKSDLLKLPAEPARALRGVLDLYDDWQADHPGWTAWRGVLWLPRRKQGCALKL